MEDTPMPISAVPTHKAHSQLEPNGTRKMLAKLMMNNSIHSMFRADTRELAAAANSFGNVKQAQYNEVRKDAVDLLKASGDLTA